MSFNPHVLTVFFSVVFPSASHVPAKKEQRQGGGVKESSDRGHQPAHLHCQATADHAERYFLTLLPRHVLHPHRTLSRFSVHVALPLSLLLPPDDLKMPVKMDCHTGKLRKSFNFYFYRMQNSVTQMCSFRELRFHF